MSEEQQEEIVKQPPISEILEAKKDTDLRAYYVKGIPCNTPWVILTSRLCPEAGFLILDAPSGGRRDIAIHGPDQKKHTFLVPCFCCRQHFAGAQIQKCADSVFQNEFNNAYERGFMRAVLAVCRSNNIKFLHLECLSKHDAGGWVFANQKFVQRIEEDKRGGPYFAGGLDKDKFRDAFKELYFDHPPFDLKNS